MIPATLVVVVALVCLIYSRQRFTLVVAGLAVIVGFVIAGTAAGDSVAAFAVTVLDSIGRN